MNCMLFNESVISNNIAVNVLLKQDVSSVR